MRWVDASQRQDIHTSARRGLSIIPVPVPRLQTGETGLCSISGQNDRGLNSPRFPRGTGLRGDSNMSSKEEFNQTLREIATLVITVFGWGMILIIAIAVTVNIWVPTSFYVSIVKDALVVAMLFGVFLALDRIYKLVFALPDDDQE